MHRVNRIVQHIKPQNEKTMTFDLSKNVTNSGKKPKTVVVTGAAGNIAYAILFQIGSGAMLGIDQPIHLRLLDIPPMSKVLEGVLMELRDMASPLLVSITATTEYQTAFQNADIACLIGAKPRGPGMVRADLLKANAGIFAGQGKALNKYASRNVKVVVVGNPANTNAMIASRYAPDIPARNFTALTRLDENRAKSQLSLKTGIEVSKIKNVTIWGNHSKTQYPQVDHGYIAYQDNQVLIPIRSVVSDDEWVNTTFIKTVQSRGAAIIKARGKSSAASAAAACCAHVYNWVNGTPQGEWTNMAVMSDGSYGTPRGVMFSFPVTCKDGEWKIVKHLKLSDFAQQKIKATSEELMAEKKSALEATQ